MDQEYVINQVVWVKLRSFPWWPAYVCDPETVSDVVLKKNKSAKKLIISFFDYDDSPYGIVDINHNSIRPFKCDDYQLFSRNSRIKKALNQAIEFEKDHEEKKSSQSTKSSKKKEKKNEIEVAQTPKPKPKKRTTAFSSASSSSAASSSSSSKSSKTISYSLDEWRRFLTDADSYWTNACGGSDSISFSEEQMDYLTRLYHGELSIDDNKSKSGNTAKKPKIDRSDDETIAIQQQLKASLEEKEMEDDDDHLP